MEIIFRERLKFCMRTSGLNQSELANKTGVNKTCVGKWLHGKNYPEYTNLLTLTTVLDCSADYLFGLSELDDFNPLPIEKDIWEILEDLIEKNKVTQYEIAKATGISQIVISRWFSLRRRPTTASLLKLSNFFGVSLEFLLGRE